MYVKHLKDLSENFIQDIAQDIKKLRSEMVDKHIQGLRNQIQCDPTLTNLQEENEVLGKCSDSLSPTVTNWSDIDATTTFQRRDSSAILCDINKFKRLSKECHCTNKINALRNNHEKKIASIPICSYKDEVTSLKSQIELVADQVNVHNT